MEVPSGLFYPFFPERKVVANRSGPPQDFSEMLAVAGAQAGGPYGQDSYGMDEEDAVVSHSGVPIWMPAVSFDCLIDFLVADESKQNTQRGVPYPVAPT
jgi:hypothetical protein